MTFSHSLLLYMLLVSLVVEPNRFQAASFSPRLRRRRRAHDAARTTTTTTTRRQHQQQGSFCKVPKLVALPPDHRIPSSFLLQSASDDNENVRDRNRRILWTKTAIQTVSGVLLVAVVASFTRPVWAAAGASKSRTEGYSVQKSEQEWKKELSPMQYYILREGGTERPYYSVLESEKRPGIFRCAGCGTPLFDASDKFTSGTGWPSFARSIEGNVQEEDVNPILASLGSGAELRCRQCGGHLGDVFLDGFLFLGTEAAKTGKRYCIDGAALVFVPNDGKGDPATGLVRGDQSASFSAKTFPSWLEPPKISPPSNKA